LLSALPVRPGAFVFCDRASGAICFQVPAAPNGELPVEQAASLLAMHCLARAQAPRDYTVLVVPRRRLLGLVGRRAQQLLSAGRIAIGSHLRLSSRQREVLACVLRDLSNKEIGAQLNVTERTVKFHVSGLLAKFRVRNRIGLKQEATMGLLPASAVPKDTLFGFAVPPELVAGTETPPPEASSGRLQRMPRVLRHA
jgi:DNA-binding CsgD family transcriptional regulator